MNEEPITAEAMMQRFREEIRRSKADDVAFFLSWPPQPKAIDARDRYLLNDFTQFDDEDFVRNAYLGLLHRAPDGTGLRHYLGILRSRRLTKADVLRAIRNSPEGKTAGVRVTGLAGVADAPSTSSGDASEGPEQKAEYTISDFQQLDDEAFVRNAYFRILKRKPDQRGFDRYLSDLQSGSLTPLEVLGSLRFSDEGHRAGTRVRGLRWRLQLAKARRIRGLRRIGNLLHKLSLIWDTGQLAPDLARKLAESKLVSRELDTIREANRLMDQRLQQLEWSIEQIAAQVAPSSRIATLSERTVQLKAAIEWLGNRVAESASRDAVEQVVGKLDSLGHEISALGSVQSDLLLLKDEKERLETHVRVHGEHIESSISNLRTETLNLRRSLLDQQRAVLATPVRSIGTQSEPSRSPAFSDDNGLDSFYLDFEDRFRGPRDEIIRRVTDYLPLVREAGAGTKEAMVIDVGCGRGEWLQVLRENNLAARGIDLNSAAVEACTEMRLDVIRADCIDFLQQQKSDSVGALTAFHVIEHLSFTTLVLLIDEALRVLRPGGMLIFETPNPENLRVGACSFYIDPTHRRPLPPELLLFVAHARGFANSKILRLHPFPAEQHLTTGDSAVRNVLNTALFSARDYALIGFK